MMEQRSEIMKRLGSNRKQSILLEQELDGRLIRFRIRKPSVYELDGCDSAAGGSSLGSAGAGHPLAGAPASPPAGPRGATSEGLPMVELQSVGLEQAATSAGAAEAAGTSSTAAEQQQLDGANAGANHLHLANLRPDEMNVRRMHTALSLNEAILRRSKQAKLVIINLPGAPKDNTPEAENNCKCARLATINWQAFHFSSSSSSSASSSFVLCS